MTSRVLSVIGLLTLALALPISGAIADPIVITGGSVIVTNPDSATGHLAGTQQFVADPEFFGTPSGSLQCRPCGAPGMLFDPSASMDTVDGGGAVQVGGASYEAGSIGGISNTAYLQLGFVADPIVLPAFSAGAVLTSPFVLANSFVTIWDAEGFPTTFALKGQGNATLELIPNAGGDELWEFGRLRYEFRPVPEPGTWLLLGAGVLGLRGWRRPTGQQQRTRATL